MSPKKENPEKRKEYKEQEQEQEVIRSMHKGNEHKQRIQKIEKVQL